MNDPYPSAAQLRAEADVCQQVREQDAAESQFRAALQCFTQVFDRLYFPLGSPVEGYDLAAIDGVLADLSIRRIITETDIADAEAVARLEGAGA